MSKKLTRKGLALATALSFGLTGLAALPSSADDAGLVTLMPSDGETFNSIKGSGISLEAGVDSDLTPAKLSFLIDNPSKAVLAISVAGETAIVKPLVNGVLGTAITGNARNASKMVVTVDGGADATETLEVDTAKATVDVAISVRSWLDKDDKGDVDANEATYSSKAESVVLYDAKNVSVSAALQTDDFFKTASAVDVDLVFSKGVNASQITADSYAVALFLNGADTNSAGVNDIDSALTDSALETDLIEPALSNKVLTAAITETIVEGNYSARVAYVGDQSAPEDFFWAGSRSASFAVSVGADTGVDGLETSTDDAKNVLPDSTNAEDVTIRTGTKSVTYTVQAFDGADELKSSNVRIKAVVAATTLVDGSKLTVSGSTTVIDSTSDTVVVYGRTDSDGKFRVTVTNSGAQVTDAYGVDFAYLTTTGPWSTGNTSADGNAVYADATLKSFKAATSILSGSSVTATLKVEDEFEQPISADSDGALKVYLTDGADFEKTVAVSGGKAVFNFANFLDKGDSASLTAYLISATGSDETDKVKVDGSTVNASVALSLYNPEATGAVIVNETADGTNTYSDFIVGEEDLTADPAITAPDTDDKIVYTGRIEDANGAGLPGAVVTISGKGLQFEEFDQNLGTPAATGIYTKDTITVVANETGDFKVYVWAHVVGDTVITVKSGAKSATTTLTTVFNTDTTLGDGITEEDVVLSWNAPKHPAVNKTYVVAVYAKDAWGNILPDATIKVEAEGALEVNGTADVTRDTNSNGRITVYVRSAAADADGYGYLKASVLSLDIDVDADGSLIDPEDVSFTDASQFEVLESELQVGKDGTAVASKTKGLVKVTAYNAINKIVKAYVSGKLVATRKATSNAYSFNVKASAGSKTVKVIVDGSTFFNESVLVK